MKNLDHNSEAMATRLNEIMSQAKNLEMKILDAIMSPEEKKDYQKLINNNDEPSK